MTARAVVYSPFWRLVSAVLVTISRVSPLVLLVLLMFFETRLANQWRLIRVFALVCLAPAIAGWLIARVFTARFVIEGGLIVLDTRRRRFEIPLDSIDRVVLWSVPFPSGGIRLRLRSGEWLDRHIGLSDPASAAAALAAAGAPIAHEPDSRAAVYATGSSGTGRSPARMILDFPVLALVPAIPLFRLHQWITYGGTFGEYYMYGFQAYAVAFAIYWATATIWLVLLAAALRAVVELFSLATAVVAPTLAPRMRRQTELAARILYYGAVPAFLVRLYFLTRTA
jgi:apolipoprotein N-acyltransferase